MAEAYCTNKLSFDIVVQVWGDPPKTVPPTGNGNPTDCGAVNPSDKITITPSNGNHFTDKTWGEIGTATKVYAENNEIILKAPTDDTDIGVTDISITVGDDQT